MKTNSRSSLHTSAGKFLSGLAQNAALPVTHVVQGTLELTRNTADHSQADFFAARQQTRLAQAAQREVKEQAQLFARLCRDHVRPRPGFGEKWNQGYAQLGFAQSLAIPLSAPALLALLEPLMGYLRRHPEIEDEARGVTAGLAEQHWKRLDAAIKAVHDAKSHQRKKRNDRAVAETALRDKLRSLQKELELILAPDDPRWIDFRDAVPADDSRPEPVEDLEATGGKAGQLEVEWEPSTRAERYLVEIQVQGLDTAFRRVTTVHDTQTTLTDLPGGAQVSLRIVAANETGEGTPSQVVTAQVPNASQAA